jgi:hypothetical protein
MEAPKRPWWVVGENPKFCFFYAAVWACVGIGDLVVALLSERSAFDWIAIFVGAATLALIATYVASGVRAVRLTKAGYASDVPLGWPPHPQAVSDGQDRS